MPISAESMTEYCLVSIAAAGFAFALTPCFRIVAFRIGAIDHPGERRVHQVAMPRLGGPVILLAMVASMVLASLPDEHLAVVFGSDAHRKAWLAAGALTITCLGAMDDVHALSPRTKLLVEAAVALAVAFGGFRFEHFGGYPLKFLSFPLTVVFVVAATNAFNLVDGLDGLAVGLSLIIGATLILLGRGGRDAVMLVALCGALMGFLPYNRHPARIFLGDSGALLLGFLIGIGAVSSSHQLSGADALLAPAVALGLPMLELLLTATRRMLRAKPLFTADRDHIHHRLLAMGIGQRKAVLILYTVGAGFCVIALMLPHLNDSLKFALLATATAYALIGARMLGYHRELQPLRTRLAPALMPIESVEPARLQIHTLEP